jgi:phytoene dehydrogenase-like protein
MTVGKETRCCHSGNPTLVLEAEEHMERFVIVGAGIAGLTAANVLADAGHHVTVLEQAVAPGGRARTRKMREYSLNLGPHALYRGGAAARAFAQWKIPFSGGSPGGSVPGQYAVLVRDHQLYPAVRSLRTLLTSSLFSAREKVELALALRSMAPDGATPSETVAQWLDRTTGLKRVREYVEMAIRVATYSVDFAHLSAQAALRQVSMALKQGVLYLDGGWQTLVDGLTSRARQLGVEIVSGSRASHVEEIIGDGIILAVDPGSVEQLTGVTLPARRPAHVGCLDLCLNAQPAGAPTVAFALDQPFYYSVHSAVARLAPRGKAVVHVAKYLSESDHDTEALRRELEEFAGLVMPGWESRVEHVRFLPKLMVTAAIPDIAGRANELLPSHDRVAVAGDWVGSDGMLADAAVASAMKAAQIIRNSRRRQPDC